MESRLEECSDIAIKAVELASGIIAASNAGSFSVWAKGEKDVQTSLDKSIEMALRRYLAEATPEIPFWGEETGRSFDDAERFWVHDPIDGTINFVHGMPLYAISLALVENGVSALGVIDAPAFGERFWAIKGQGAFCNGNPLSVSLTSERHEAMLCYGDPDVGLNAAKNNRNYDPFLRKWRDLVRTCRIIGSAALQLAWLAAGRIDISITWGNLPWDVQAGVILVREAGGVAMDMDGTNHCLASKYTIACNSNLHECVKREAQAFSSLNDKNTAEKV